MSLPPTPSRLAPREASQAGPLTALFLRVIYGLAKLRVKLRTPTPMKVQGHQPAVLLGYGLMEESLTYAKSLPPALKVLCNLRAASRIGCRF
ncbi:MAG: hypothetical protein FJ100_10765 [Deltaproteobacteria bacterium]|nr:hypothetical protein [Deltaproteobacteria bacterium]